ncbi:Uncharacterised protein [Moraxella lacunata]|uniref:Uncharacterized protein n=1 Tax=Moraxella lacunata TaxID=477 RepID=A0A378TRZ7_MORLA|nr:hypothetical protein [Moraxella lacunata]STZ63431.1 Uncharacterised protein [Moraxella lacunata]
MNELQKTYRYLFKLPISVPLIILFFMLMVTDKQALVMLLRKEGAIWISVALFVVLACEFIFKKVVKFYCTNGQFSNEQLENANQKAKWVVYFSIVALVFSLFYMRYLIKIVV